MLSLFVACSGEDVDQGGTNEGVGTKASDSPVIEVWYGDTQRFGHVGNPQVWANILGNVSDANGIASLTYSLNGGPPNTLTVGADPYRLQQAGDFNIDLLRADLSEGTNQVVITATDAGSPSSQTQKTVTVEYDSGGQAPLPYAINWDQMSQFDDKVAMVDGFWERQGASVRTVVPGWDRLIAFGDMSWGDYEITVPILFHNMPSIGAVGLIMRWHGHTDEPADFAGVQPKAGFHPIGSILWFKGNQLTVHGNRGETLGSQSRNLSTGVWYVFKARGETIPGVGAEYSLKVWEHGQPEPAQWDVVGQELTGYAVGGGAMLVSHEADASFGNVIVDPLPLSVRDVSVTVGSELTEATVTWSTNQPATSSIAYGLTTSYELGTQSDPTLKSSHSITLPGLSPDNEYHYQVTSEDGQGNPLTTADMTFDTSSAGPPVDCSVVPSQYVGVSDGCDCPADGSFDCDPDCIDDGNTGGGWCGCQYCYGNPSGPPPTGECSDVPLQYIGVGDGCDCPADGDLSCDSDCTVFGNPGGSWCGCQYCYGSTGGTGGTGGSAGTGGTGGTGGSAGTGGTGGTAGAGGTSGAGGTAGTGGAAPADCSVVPPQYIGVSDGCDCPPDGSLTCDSDCTDDGNPGGSWCGCQYCYGDPLPLPGACSVVPIEYVGQSDGCDCPADGSFECDPDCINDGNAGGSWCGCQYCYGTQP